MWPSADSAYIYAIDNVSLDTDIRIRTNLNETHPDCFYFFEIYQEICDNDLDDDGDGLIDCADPDCGCTNGELEFCTYNLNLDFNETFNIRDYVQDKNDPSAILNWSEIYFTYTAVGANNPTMPNDWHLADFNNGNNVTVTAADAAPGMGNHGDGEYRIYLVRNGESDFDDQMTIRVQSGNSNKEEAKCNSAPEICDNGIDDDGDGLIDCADSDCYSIANIDFETDGNGNTLNPSDDPIGKWANLGIHFSNDDPTNHALSIFDSANPTQWETDAGTPNTDFGGPGEGIGGGSGMIGENANPLNNMLIISGGSSPSQDIYWQGGIIFVDFDVATYVAGVEIVDIGHGEVNGKIRTYDGAGTLLSEHTVYGCGENSYQKVAIRTGNIRKLEIDIPHSYAVGSILFCDNDLPSASIGDLVWNDINGDGSPNGESGLANVEVSLYDNANNLLAETYTNNSGAYSFDNLVGGQYRVGINAPNGYSATHDLNGGNDNNSGVFTLAANENKTDVDFGLNTGTTPPPTNPCDGHATVASGAVRNGAASNATGAPDGVTTEVGASTDFLTVTLPDELAIGTQYTIHISGRNGSATTDVFEAPDGTTLPTSQQTNPAGFTLNGQATGANGVITQVTKTAAVATKYLYFDRGSGDIEIDAVTYDSPCSEICDNGIDDDGDGAIDNDDPDCFS